MKNEWVKSKGYQSVSDTSLVLVKFRNGAETTSSYPANGYEWDHCDHDDDIMFHKVVGKVKY